MKKQEITNLFKEVTTWKRRGQRAPHKPLLILLALHQSISSSDRLLKFKEIEQPLKQLLIDFGPKRVSYHPEYPFWRLQKDDIWELSNTENVTARKSNTDAKKSELIKYGVSGGFKKEIYEQLASNPELVIEIAQEILEQHFPSSLHDDILQAIGLYLEIPEQASKRDPRFRDRILSAYEYQCAVCGFNVRVGHSLIGLEAAHIKWHQAGGPDSEDNGLCLCTLHHKLLDRGAFTLAPDKTIQVSDLANGTKGFAEWLLTYHGKQIRSPQRPEYDPNPKFLTWHYKEVFQGSERYHAPTSL